MNKTIDFIKKAKFVVPWPLQLISGVSAFLILIGISSAERSGVMIENQTSCTITEISIRDNFLRGSAQCLVGGSNSSTVVRNPDLLLESLKTNKRKMTCDVTANDEAVSCTLQN